MRHRIFTLLVTFALAWVGLAVLYGQTPAPRVGCRVEQWQISTGASTDFVIFVDQLPPLTAFTLTLNYDPIALQFQDQDQAMEGINLTPGDVFPAAAISQNLVNPLNGQIQLAVSQPVSSSITGNLAELARGTISGVSQTVAPFRFTETILYDHNARLMDRFTYAVEECFVEIGNSGSPTPAPTATYFLSPLLTATPTPPDFTSIAPTVTPTPTITPTPTPGPTSPLATPDNTATPSFTPLPTATPTDTDTPEPTPTDTETPTPTTLIITNPAGLDNNQSPLETPTPPLQETPTESPVPTPTETETPIPTDTPTAEVVSLTETPTPLPTPTDTPTPTPEPSPTPTSLSQAGRALGETVEVVNQSTPSTRPTQQPYRLLALAALFGGLALLLAFWQLRRWGNHT